MQRRWIGGGVAALIVVALSYLAWTQVRGSRTVAAAGPTDPLTVRLDQLTARVERLEGELARMRSRRPAAALASVDPASANGPAGARMLMQDGVELDPDEREGGGVARRVQRLAEIANLNEQQVQAVSTVLQAERAKIVALRQSSGAAGAASVQREDIQAIRKQTDVELERVLDDQQYAAYETMRRNRAQRANARARPRPSTP
jgi:hypothetical protein